MAEERLDIPGRRRISSRWRLNDDAFGSFAEATARFMGTGRFIMWMTVFVIIWISLNTVLLIWKPWDPYPFILLNLAFSTQASYAAPLILLAQNRQERRDRVMFENDREIASQSRADMDFLAREIASLRLRMNDVATRDFIRSELRDLLVELSPSELESVPETEAQGDPAPT